MAHEVTAFIPFRKGSAGVVDKNIRQLCGRPLWWHTMNAALTGGVDRVILATDYDGAILGELPEGVDVWSRQGMHNTDSKASTDMVVRDWLEAMPEVTGTVILLQVTNQFTTSSDVQRAVAEYNREPLGVLISAVKCEHIIWRRGTAGMWECTPIVRRQAMPEQWIENGAFHVFTADYFRRYGTRYAGKVRFCPMCPESIHDIDTEEDWQLVRELVEGQL